MKVWDIVGFINQNKSANIEFKATVKSLSKLNVRYYIITFNEKVAG